MGKWEHPLEFTTLHNEYRKLFEDRVDEFLETEGVDVKKMLDDVMRDMEDNPGPMRSLLDALVASEDYMRFCSYMQQISERRLWAEGKWAPPVDLPDATSADEEVSELNGMD